MMGFQSSCIMLGSSAEMCCSETPQIGFESFWVQLFKWVAYLELLKVGQNRKYVGNTLFIFGVFTIYSLQCTYVSQIFNPWAQDHVGCPLAVWTAGSLLCVGLCCGQEVFGGVTLPCRCLWRQMWGNPASTCLWSSPGACWPWSSSQRAAGRGRLHFSPLTGGETPGPALWVCHGANSVPGLRTEELFPRSPLIATVPFCDSLGVILLGIVFCDSSNGVVVALIPSWVFCLFPSKL